MAEQTLKVPTNTLGDLHFLNIDYVAKFAAMNARRLSGTLELLSKAEPDTAMLPDALAMLTDIAFQVAGAVDILANAVESKGGAGHA